MYESSAIEEIRNESIAMHMHLNESKHLIS